MVDGMRFWRAMQKGKWYTWQVTELDINNRREELGQFGRDRD